MRAHRRRSPGWGMLALTWAFVLAVQLIALISRSGVRWLALALLVLAALGLVVSAVLWQRGRRGGAAGRG